MNLLCMGYGPCLLVFIILYTCSSQHSTACNAQCSCLTLVLKMHMFNFITLFLFVAHPGHPFIEATVTQQMYKKVSVSLDSWTTLLDGSEGVEVSCDWRRVGHVTTVLLSDWRWAGRWSAAWCAWRPAAAPPCDMTGTPGPASQPSW